jgi:hypothetical protein
VQMIGDGQAQIGYSVAGRSGGRVMPCVFVQCTNRQGAQVSWFSLKTKVDSFSRFGLKIGGYNSCGLASKSSGLLHLKASRARVSQSSLKTS